MRPNLRAHRQIFASAAAAPGRSVATHHLVPEQHSNREEDDARVLREEGAGRANPGHPQREEDEVVREHAFRLVVHLRGRALLRVQSVVRVDGHARAEHLRGGTGRKEEVKKD